jgi:hypothetical protein
MLGGWNTGKFPPSLYDTPGDVTNAVLYSDDGGATWGTLLAHNSTPGTSRFYPGHTAGVFLHTSGGVEYVYWIGGDANAGAGRDGGVWRSADGGSTWTRISTAAPTVGVSLFMVTSFNGAIYIMGGQTTLSNTATALNTVWRSTDDGVTWTQLANAPWASRCAVLHPTVWNGKIWLVAGAKYATQQVDRIYYNDVWNFDGTTWTQVLADGHSQFTPRLYHSLIVYQNRLVMINGFIITSTNNGEADVHWTDDGTTWNAIDPASIAWFKTHAQGVTVTRDGSALVMNQGIANESIYTFKSIQGTLASAWGDVGSGALSLTQSTNATKPLYVPFAFGAQPGIALTCNQEMRLAAIDRNVPGVFEMWWIGKSMNVLVALGNVIPQDMLLGVASNAGQAYSYYGLNGDQLEYVDNTAGLSKSIGGSGLTDDVARVLGVEHQFHSVKLYVNNVQQGATNTTASFDPTYTGWDALGAASTVPPNHGESMTGAFVVLKLSAASSSTFRTKLHMWAQKWTA